MVRRKEVRGSKRDLHDVSIEFVLSAETNELVHTNFKVEVGMTGQCRIMFNFGDGYVFSPFIFFFHYHPLASISLLQQISFLSFQHYTPCIHHSLLLIYINRCEFTKICTITRVLPNGVVLDNDLFVLSTEISLHFLFHFPFHSFSFSFIFIFIHLHSSSSSSSSSSSFIFLLFLPFVLLIFIFYFVI